MTTAFMFPGQGAQRVGMGQALIARYDTAAAVFARASEIMGYDLARTCARARPEDLRATRVAQPAIFVVGAAACAVLRDWGISLEAAAGHSVGEITAFYAAGVLDFDTALQLVIDRAELMSKVKGVGAMVAVIGLTEADVLRACSDASSLGCVVIGLHNAPSNYVLSGDAEAVLAAAHTCRDGGATKVTRLQTQHAFHSPLMESILDEWTATMATVELHQPSVPIAVNATGHMTTEPEELRAALVRQMNGTVRWYECVERLRAAGVDRFIEAADTKVLTALVRSASREVQVVTLADHRADRRLGAIASRRGGSRAVS